MLTLAIVLAAAPAVAAPAGADLSSRQCVAVEVVQPGGQRVVSKEKGRRRKKPPVSATETVDLELQVVMRPVLKGDHVLRLSLFTPRGYLYQSMTLPFRFVSPKAARKARGEETTRMVAGFPRPLDVQLLTRPARRRPTANRVTARLPVAGTSISLGSLYGQWRVAPFIDDGTAPCGPATTFEIAE